MTPTVQALAVKAARLATESAQALAELSAALAATPPPPPPSVNGDGPLLTPTEIKDVLRLDKVSQVYSLARRSDWAPHVVRAGRRVLRFKPTLLAMLERGGPC